MKKKVQLRKRRKETKDFLEDKKKEKKRQIEKNKSRIGVWIDTRNKRQEEIKVDFRIDTMKYFRDN